MVQSTIYVFIFLSVFINIAFGSRYCECEDKLPKCGKNERAVKCKTSCPTDRCLRLYVQFDCLANQPCKPGCICENGFWRHNGTCIPKENCPPVECVNDDNAVVGCSERCGRTCADYNKPKPCPRICKKGCACGSDHIYDNNVKRCVLPKDCTVQCTKPHEHYTDCYPGQCQAKTCAELEHPIPCPRVKPPCKGACICDEGYVRDVNGNCILIKDCPKKCKKPHEIYTNCYIGQCKAKTCDEVGKPVKCPRIRPPCKGGCICEEGYVRGCNGDCIQIKDCPDICEDTNSHYSDCPDPCPATCQYTLPQQCKLPCSPGCQCNEGYVLSKPGGICVKLEECPDYADCGTNKTFRACNFKCPKDVCLKSDWPTACRPGNPCAGGCGCLPGYRFTDNDDCILANECPEIECERPNQEWWSCASPDLMEDCFNQQNQQDLPPTDLCSAQCVCQKDFFRDSLHYCIPAGECPTE